MKKRVLPPAATTELCSQFGMLTGKAMQIADDVTDLESLLSGKKAGIGGSEAILLRCCLGQTPGTEEPDRNAPEQVDPLGTARRKDVEDRLGRYLDTAVREAVVAAQRLMEALRQDERTDRPRREVPEMRSIPGEIAAMVLNERK